MRLAILSESSADEAALRVLADAVLGINTIAPHVAEPRTRGWSGTLRNCESIAKALHYNTDADAFIIVGDSNHQTVVHGSPQNRLHQLNSIALNLRRQLGPRSGRPPLRIAVGIASPAIEAWLLCSESNDISEAKWEKGLETKRDPYSKLELKQRLSGSDKLTLTTQTQRMVAAALELRTKIPLLEERFPYGFGVLAEELRRWRSLT